jgi:hypothetical protein
MNLEKVLSKGSDWITITDTDLVKKILESYLDEEKKKILSSVIYEAKISGEILKECNIVRSSGYRKIKSLIDDGLIVAKNTIEFPNGVIAKQYISLISSLKIDFDDGKVIVKVQRNPNSL